MEPLTAIAVIAAKHGAAGLIRALSGQEAFGDLASELVGALAASEERLGERLARIEYQLDEVLEQRYQTAIGTGLRTLLDAGTTADARHRADELVRARDVFREATASARTGLQIAIAERYLALCAFALGRTDAARTAVGRVNVTAFEALMDAAVADGSDAKARLGRVGRLRRAGRSTAVVNAEEESVQFAGSLLREAAVLEEGLGPDSRPASRWVPVDRTHPIARTPGYLPHRWEVSGRRAEPVGFGPVCVTWHSVRPRPVVTPPTVGLPLTWEKKVDVDLMVRIDPALSRSIELTLDMKRGRVLRDGTPVPPEHRWTLPAGQRTLEIRVLVTGLETNPTLNAGGVVLFRPPPA